jgi:hypothetical protein
VYVANFEVFTGIMEDSGYLGCEAASLSKWFPYLKEYFAFIFKRSWAMKKVAMQHGH